MTTKLKRKKNMTFRLVVMMVGLVFVLTSCMLRAGEMYNVYNDGINGVMVPIFAIPTNQIGTLHKQIFNGDYNKTADYLHDNVPIVKGTFEFNDPFGGIDGIAEWRYGLTDPGQRASMGTVVGILINQFGILDNWNAGAHCLTINKWLSVPSGWHQQWTIRDQANNHQCPPGQNWAS